MLAWMMNSGLVTATSHDPVTERREIDSDPCGGFRQQAVVRETGDRIHLEDPRLILFVQSKINPG